MIIDVHTHMYPSDYLAAMQKVGKEMQVTQMGERKVIVKGEVPVVALTEAMWNPELRLKEMDALGVNLQVLSLTFPSVNFVNPHDGLLLAQAANNTFAELQQRYSGRFVGLASVPLKDVISATAELKRAINDLKLKGVCILSNIDGVPIDRKEFWPFFAAVEELAVPLFIHPGAPSNEGVMKEYWLAPIIGMAFETTICATRMAFSGLLAEFPGLKIIFSHLGGAAPYLFGRMDQGYDAHPECRENIPLPPSFYLKHVYYDVISYHKPALVCAYESVGTDKLLFGTDYPHAMGDVPKTVKSIKEWNIASEEKDSILFRNALKLLKL
jgi:aminocarboxymuconate-semialdehyde decarboxylase